MNVQRRLAIVSVGFALAPPGILHAAPAHSGIADIPGIEPSDFALFGFAVVGVWLARRSMRARARSRRAAED